MNQLPDDVLDHIMHRVHKLRMADVLIEFRHAVKERSKRILQNTGNSNDYGNSPYKMRYAICYHSAVATGRFHHTDNDSCKDSVFNWSYEYYTSVHSLSDDPDEFDY